MPRDIYSVGYDDASAEFFGRRRAATHARFFLRHLMPGTRLLDIGCGPGTITVDLAQVVAPGEVVGVDLEPSQIELAQARAAAEQIQNVRFQAADIYSLPFDNDSFNAIFLHGVLEHLTDPIRALHEVQRVLKPGGVVGSRHADFGGFLIEPSFPPLDQFASLFSRLMQHNGADPHAGRHQFRWLNEADFEAITMSASYDCWTSTPDEKAVTARFLQSLVGDSSFARQLLEAGLADQALLQSLREAFAEWAIIPTAFAAEAWTEAIALRT